MKLFRTFAPLIIGAFILAGCSSGSSNNPAGSGGSSAATTLPPPVAATGTSAFNTVFPACCAALGTFSTDIGKLQTDQTAINKGGNTAAMVSDLNAMKADIATSVGQLTTAITSLSPSDSAVAPMNKLLQDLHKTDNATNAMLTDCATTYEDACNNDVGPMSTAVNSYSTDGTAVANLQSNG